MTSNDEPARPTNRSQVDSGHAAASGDDREEAEIRIGWKMGGLGLEVSSQVLAGLLLGWLWDKWRGTAPTGMTVGGIAGIAVGMWSLIRGALKLNRQLEQSSPTKGRGKPIPFEDDQNGESEDNDSWN